MTPAGSSPIASATWVTSASASHANGCGRSISWRARSPRSLPSAFTSRSRANFAAGGGQRRLAAQVTLQFGQRGAHLVRGDGPRLATSSASSRISSSSSPRSSPAARSGPSATSVMAALRRPVPGLLLRPGSPRTTGRRAGPGIGGVVGQPAAQQLSDFIAIVRRPHRCSDSEEPDVKALGPLPIGIADPAPPADSAPRPSHRPAHRRIPPAASTASTLGRRTDRASRKVITSSITPATTVEIIVSAGTRWMRPPWRSCPRRSRWKR